MLASAAPMVTDWAVLVMIPTPNESVVPATGVTAVVAPVWAMRQEFAVLAPVLSVRVMAVVPPPASL